MPRSITDVDHDVVSLSVHAREYTCDVNVATTVPIVKIARQIAIDVARQIAAVGGNNTWLTEPDSTIILSPPVGTGWDQSKTLSQLRVVNGTVVQLTTQKANERFPELIESQADAAAAVRNEKFLPWDTKTSHLFSAWALPLIVALLAGAALVFTAGQSYLTQLIFGVLTALAGVGAATVAYAFSRAGQKPHVAAPTSAVAYLTLPAAALMCVPAGTDGGLSPWGVLAAGVILTAMAWLSLALQFEPKWVHAAALVPGVSVTVGMTVTVLYGLWRDVEPYAACIAVMIVAILMAYAQVLTSKSMAKILDPHLPSTGAELQLDSLSDVADVFEDSMSDESREAIVHQRSRTIEARFIGIGILVGAGLTLTIAAIIAGAYARQGDETWVIVATVPTVWVLCLTVAVCCACMALSATWYRDRVQRGVGMALPLVAWLAFVVALVTYSPVTSPVVIGVLMLVSTLVLGVAVAKSFSETPPMSHTAAGRLQRLESFCYTLPLPLVALLFDLAYNLRHL